MLFQEILKRIRKDKLNFGDIEVLDRRLAIKLPVLSSLNTIIIVQKNKTHHFINQLQIEKFARENNEDIIIFLVKYYITKKDGGNLIQQELLFEA